MSTTENKTYVGHCHCGAYKFTLTRPPVTSVTACNCSICSRNAYLYVDVPEGSTFKVERGADKLTRYTFGSAKWVHDFCQKCGITCLVKELDTNPERFYINARVLQDIDLKSLKVEECDPSMDGKTWPGDWKPKDAVRPPSVQGERLQTYAGQCHCGKVRYAFKSNPLPEIEVCECDCSYCSRTGQLCAYIPHENIHWEGLEHCTVYQGVGSGGGKHLFCCTCGVYMGMDTKDQVIPEEQLKYIPPDVLENIKKCPVNIRTLIDELDEKKLKIKQETNKGGYSVE